MTYELIQVRTEAGKVGIVTLNRPKIGRASCRERV